VVLASSDWLLPMHCSVRDHTHHGADHAVIQITCDEGRTWGECPVPGSRGRVQASVIELAPGRVVAFFRSRAAEGIYVSRSADAGRTRTVPQRTALPNNNSWIKQRGSPAGPSPSPTAPVTIPMPRAGLDTVYGRPGQ